MASFNLITVVAVSLIGLTINLSGAHSQKTNCDQQLYKTDECIRKALLIGDHDLVMPKNSNEMDSHCAKGRDHIQCIRSYGKCLRLFPRQIFGILVGNVRKIFVETCETSRGRQEFLKHSKCMLPEYLSEVHFLADRMTIHFDYIAQNVSNNDKIPWLCCAYFVNYDFLTKTVNNLCSGITGPETVQYVVSLFDKAMSEVVDLGCGRFSSAKQCKALLPKSVAVYQDLVTPASKVVPQKTSFLVPLIKITKDLDSH